MRTLYSKSRQEGKPSKSESITATADIIYPWLMHCPPYAVSFLECVKWINPGMRPALVWAQTRRAYQCLSLCGDRWSEMLYNI